MKFDSMRETFTNEDANPVTEDKLTIEQRIERARDVRKMVMSKGFEILEELVSFAHKSLASRLGYEKETHEMKRIQGKMTGIANLRSAVIRVLTDGERAKMELGQREARRSNARRRSESEAGSPFRPDSQR